MNVFIFEYCYECEGQNYGVICENQLYGLLVGNVVLGVYFNYFIVYDVVEDIVEVVSYYQEYFLCIGVNCWVNFFFDKY